MRACVLCMVSSCKGFWGAYVWVACFFFCSQGIGSGGLNLFYPKGFYMNGCGGCLATTMLLLLIGKEGRFLLSIAFECVGGNCT
ncbi:hypothetical protein F5B22DRAFT_610343 [Xylaria bambusicola]|uniref:uncharacterized protein n=1 Tax=Xylaria bambusicola TaxID=326684 RepID=UPI002007DAC7|nr:uncharacterized protein F5B22DRAFT_610343 [Xylaria bambusicola]KAI0514680.1 hypothetical protein F5B22DRAFT_610343 [Xylaria bambusicola]